MNAEQCTATEQIALLAFGLDRTEREVWLHEHAHGDPEVLAAVRRRLEVAEKIPAGFLEQPAIELWSGDEERTEPSPAIAEAGELPFAEGRRYLLVETLGAGGMAVVYRAFDRRLLRPVAVKHLRPELAADPQALRRFEREARIAAQVSHPAIVEVFDVLRDGDDLWIVMELVPGRSLASLLSEGPLELGKALSLAADVADGLAAIHAQGIVYQDLKAANVMVMLTGRAKILDFGLARPVSGEDVLMAGCRLCGTPSAMSPEQVSGSPVDTRSDLFALGSLLYQMVTGTSPFEGSIAVITLGRVCRLCPPPVNQLNPCVSEELSSLIAALLEKDPERRPRDTAAVASALARLAAPTTSGRPAEGLPPSFVAVKPSSGSPRRSPFPRWCGSPAPR